MDILARFYTKEFSDVSFKKAYIKACSWLYTVVLVDDEISKDLVWKIVFPKECRSLPSVSLELYGVVSDLDHARDFCKMCKQEHTFNCEKCNMKAYRLKAKKRINAKKSYKRKLLGEKVLL